MDLSPYIDSLRRDLTATAAAGGPDVARAAELLTGAIDAAVRLCLLEALSDAAAEITTKLGAVTVDVRLRGREADLVVTEADFPAEAPGPAASFTDAAGDVTRMTLRLPESLKEAIERAAAAEGISVNAWLVRAITASVRGGARPGPPGRPTIGRRVTGFAQA